jgi:hypothetical protein
VPLLVHITNEDETESVRRSGIKIGKYRDGVYAMPMSQNFIVSNQWLRELKRRVSGSRTLSAIHEIRTVPQVVGWRYHPNARARNMCGCPACLPAGTYKSRIFRERFYDGAVLRQGLRRLEWLGISVPNRTSRRSSTG